MRISNDRLLDDLKELGEIGASEGRGRTRVVFSAEDFEARDFLIGRMKEAGLVVRIDDVGNIIGRRGDHPRKLPVVALGSHIDTVPNAGMLDGCYGVVGALEVIRTLQDNDVVTSLPLEVIAFSDEEGVRFPLTVGSKVLAGLTTVRDALQLKDSAGVSYLQALESWGRPSSSLVPARRESGEFKAWVELHIEQGSALDSSGVKIGIVEAIVGITQLLVTIRGEAGHAGASPMVGRHDALRGGAQIVLDVNRIAQETGASTVGTVGHLVVRPGVMNVIPGEVELGVDFRDASASLIDSGVRKIRDAVEATCAAQGLKCTINERAKLAPTPMSKNVMSSIERAARELGASYAVMQSGAAHDTQNMARICDVGMIFVPSKGGISHSPLEWTDPEDLELGANVLLKTALGLSGQV